MPSDITDLQAIKFQSFIMVEYKCPFKNKGELLKYITKSIFINNVQIPCIFHILVNLNTVYEI